MNRADEIPSITVVVPSYNQGQFLKKTLTSIFSQQYPKLEVIVMDGGSTDNSVDIIKSFESQLSYWQSQPDGGQAAAIDAGMRRAKGDLVAWLNSDDFYLQGAFKHIVKVYQQNPEASFYAGNGYRVTESGMIKAPFYKHNDIVFDRNALIYSVDYIMQPSTFMSRKCLEQVNYLNHDLHFGMDWDLFIRLSGCAEPVLFFEYISASREYASTKTSSGYFKRIEELRCIASSHSGYEITPGVMFYLMGDLMTLCRKHPDLYPKSYLLTLHELWLMNKAILEKTGLDTSGFIFPVKQLPQKPSFYKKVGSILFRYIGKMVWTLLRGMGRTEESLLKFRDKIEQNLLKFRDKINQSLLKFKDKMKEIILKCRQRLGQTFFVPLRNFLVTVKQTIRIWRRYIRSFPRISPFLYHLSDAIRTLYYRLKHGFYAK